MFGLKLAVAAGAFGAPHAVALQLQTFVDGTGICDSRYACCPHADYKKHEPAHKFPIKLVLASGCSGSTAVMKIAEELHKSAAAAELKKKKGTRTNYYLADCMERREVLNDISSGLYTNNKPINDEMLPEAIKELAEANAATGRAILFKDQADFVISSAEKDGKLSKYLRANAKATAFVRHNLIDLMMCSIKDGFGGEGANIGSCPTCGQFRGRGKDEGKESSLITIEKDLFLYGLNKLYIQEQQKVNWAAGKHLTLLEESSNFTEIEEPSDGPVTFEDLFEFEWNKNAVDKSAQAWHRLMTELGSDMDFDLIKNFLSTLPTLPAPEKHTSMISNAEAVYAELKACKDHKKYDDKWCDELNAMWRA